MSTEWESSKILVLDRRFSEFERCAWALRHYLAAGIGRAFAGWAISPARGRFVVLDFSPDCSTLEEMLTFVDEECELLARIRDRVRTLPPGDRHIALFVAPDLESRVREAMDNVEQFMRATAANDRS